MTKYGLKITDKDRESMRNTLVYQSSILGLNLKLIIFRLCFMKMVANEVNYELNKLKRNPERLFFPEIFKN